MVDLSLMNKRLVVLSLSTLAVVSSCGGSDSDTNRRDRNSALSPSTTLGVSADANKVTLCHATASKTNPYQVITVDVNSLKTGHGGHTGPVFDGKVKGWGDIIPPFMIVTAGKETPRVGQNWPEGKSIFENGCATKRSDKGDDGDVVSTSTSSTLPNDIVLDDEEDATTTTTSKMSTSTTVSSSPSSSTPDTTDKPAPTTTASGGNFEQVTTTTATDSSIAATTTVPTKTTVPDVAPPTDPNPDPTPQDLPIDPGVEQLVITPEQVDTLTGGNGTLRVRIDDGDFVDVGPEGTTINISSASKVTFSVTSPGAGGERYVAYRIVRPAPADDSNTTPLILGGVLLVGLLALFLVLAKRRKRVEEPS